MDDLKIQQKARAAQEKFYHGTCTVIECIETQDEESKISYHDDTTLIEDQPCHLSFESLNPTTGSDTASTAPQTAKLFVAPELKIKPGSKIIVTQHGVAAEYASSGDPAVYPTHQEIMLVPFQEWA